MNRGTCLPKLENASTIYGARMGRRDTLPDDVVARVKLCLRRLPMVGDYDSGGAYWGGWSAARGGMWIAWGDGVRVFVRALDRDSAKKLVLGVVPGAVFYK